LTIVVDKWQLLGVNLLDFRRAGRTWNPELRKGDPKPEDLAAATPPWT